MFEQLSDRLNATFERLRGRPRVSESDLEEALRDVRVALLEADVNFKVVRQLVATVRERALGEKVIESITGAQQVVKIVHDALVEMLGGAATPLARAERPPTVILLVGLQGSGKTTTIGKLALKLNEHGRSVLDAEGTILKVTVLPAELAEKLSLLERLAASDGYAATGRAGLGVFLVRLGGHADAQARIIDGLRRSFPPGRGSAVIMRGSPELRNRIDVWGPTGDGLRQTEESVRVVGGTVVQSWPQIGVPAGLLLANGVFSYFSGMPEDQFLSWGWRVPFWLSVVVVIAGVVIVALPFAPQRWLAVLLRVPRVRQPPQFRDKADRFDAPRAQRRRDALVIGEEDQHVHPLPLVDLPHRRDVTIRGSAAGRNPFAKSDEVVLHGLLVRKEEYRPEPAAPAPV